jgi:SpoVK/Ycf46/Vps4 family AAA+-type ATPase
VPARDADVLRLAAEIPVARPAIAAAVALAADAPTLERLAECARAQVHSQLARYAEPSRARSRLADLVLDSDGREQIAEIIEAYRNRAAVRAVRGGLGLGRSFIVLLNGPPGTGKSLSAGIIAAEIGLPLYRIDVSRIFDRYVGETEKNLVRLFEEAAADRAALLFDEADSLFSRRVDVKDAGDRHANNQVNVLLECIERHEGLVLLTTNLKSGMDQALLRRITYKLEFVRPDAAEREALWRAHLPDDACAGDVDLGALAREFRSSGAEIRNAVTRAALASGASPIAHALLRRSILREIEAAGGVVVR